MKSAAGLGRPTVAVFVFFLLAVTLPHVIRSTTCDVEWGQVPPDPPCPENCVCRDDTSRSHFSTKRRCFNVTCTGKGLRSRMENLPALLPKGCVVISLTLIDYNLSKISKDFFARFRTHLLELHLISCHITSFHEKTFCYFKKLKTLSMSHNLLTTIPDWPFWKTPNLKSLDLSYNLFKGTGFVASSLCIQYRGSENPVLEKLNLQGCQINYLVSGSFDGCRLKNLDISSNNLSYIGRQELTGFSIDSNVVINLKNNVIHTMTNNSGVLRVMQQSHCSASMQHRILLLSGNQFCCNDKVLWMRRFKLCIDHDQPCYSYKETLFTFKPHQSNTCKLAPEPQHPLKSSLLSIIIVPSVVVPLLVVMLMIVGCVSYHRYRQLGQHLTHTVVEKSTYYGSTKIAPNLSSFLVSYTSLHLREQIGSGGYGTVYRAKLHGSTVAVKMINSQSMYDTGTDISAFIREAEVLSKLHHENIVRLLGLCTEPGYVCIVMEYVRKGSVKNLLRTLNISISWLQKLKMIIDAANGMVYLHSRRPPVIHRDLKSSNLLVNNHWRVKVCDFGVAKHIKDTHALRRGSSRNTRAPGTLRFTAPEMMADRPIMTSKADVYSFAIVLWEFTASSIPPVRDPGNLSIPPSYLCPFPEFTLSYQVNYR
ncbi:uncharacterized protein LOC134189701 isoform X2 [Corticium candelabrum]|uniref:uncharacterized protein LOC134189701 isoform X2 n=1 Tax=Corticium candelabrum TaxID=121492 RepID=UPI002E25EEFC|nr:uncharacterized protein LOC134189701 isoform X2 [Corticium candelabrum]